MRDLKDKRCTVGTETTGATVEQPRAATSPASAEQTAGTTNPAAKRVGSPGMGGWNDFKLHLNSLFFAIAVIAKIQPLGMRRNIMLKRGLNFESYFSHYK